MSALYPTNLKHPILECGKKNIIINLPSIFTFFMLPENSGSNVFHVISMSRKLTKNCLDTKNQL